MHYSKKIISFLLSLVMLLSFSTGVLAADNEVEGEVRISKFVDTEETEVPETEFVFDLRDPAGRALEDYGITLVQNTVTASANVDAYLRFKVDTSKINPESGWEPMDGSYHHLFELTEQNGGATGWSYDPTLYMLDVVYDGANLLVRSYRGSVAEENSADVVFYNRYEGTATVEIPFAKVVKQGGNTAPGQQAFELEIFGIGNSNVEEYADVTCTAAVETSGVGSYTGKIVLAGPKNQVDQYICEGFFVREKNTAAADWTYSQAVYHVNPYATETGNGFNFFPAEHRTGENGEYYEPAEMPVEEMVFENTYTHNDVSPVSLEISFTKVVKQGGNTAPGQQTFELEIFGIGNSNVEEYADVTCTAAVETNGAGSYTGEIVLTGPKNQVDQYICEGFFVREKNTAAADWTYSQAVYHVNPYATETGNGFIFFPAERRTSENGEYYVPAEQPAEQMVFENTYTHNTTAEPEQTPAPTPSGTSTITVNAPQTSDSGNVLFAILLLLVSGAGFAGTILFARKKEASNK